MGEEVAVYVLMLLLLLGDPGSFLSFSLSRFFAFSDPSL